MDVSQYLEIFIDETKEHLQSLNEHLLIIEKEPDNKDTINEIFRAAHSLKGMAGTMGYKRMQRLTHDMENVLSEIRNGKMSVTAELVDVLFQCLDALEAYLENIQQTSDEGTDDNEKIVGELNRLLGGESTAAVIAKTAGKTAAPASDENKYRSIKIADYEMHAFDEAVSQGMNVYGLTVYVQESCVLKAARAFLVFKAIEELGEIVRAEPGVDDIEDEKFDFDFSLLVISEHPVEKIIKAVENVSEIAKATGGKIELKSDSVSEAGSAETKENEKEQPGEAKEQKNQAVSTKKQGKPVSNRTVRVDIEKLDELMNLVSELIIAKNSIVSADSTDSGRGRNGFRDQIEYLERVTTNLHESVMKVRMVPIESVVNRFPRMIRDLSKKLDKKMELYMSGEDTELDRTVIDEIGDPLMHLLRNSADHGLESGEKRIARGKNEQGAIFLDAYQDGNNVVIEVRDDGNGIDVENVREKAVERGTITREQADTMNDRDIINLLFLPSFSMSKKVSDISGRGVGLDVVKSKIESLGGDVEVRSVLGEGSKFIIRLPLTLAIIQALMVEVAKEKYAIPLGTIQTIEDIPVSDIRHVQGREVIHLRGAVIPVVRMNGILETGAVEEAQENMTVVIIKKGDRFAGLVVDSLIGQQEIVIKPIGKYIRNSKLISGATILGDGEVALILDVNTLV
ncbi:chemotaxis protein CheA [Anaerobium acetethylicum]|uniref:Chemotaxis protein CheA n=1 Tax=Anaerobium acetethylicum TaxID=1619234 RepID=A0A1D3TQP0_9FIRM|nr:two-component system, chemotaxis family, sensor kinase CheA [Anaerobium acetethylicum]